MIGILNIYIDVTSFLRTDFITGIQRSVLEFVDRIARDQSVHVFLMCCQEDDSLDILELNPVLLARKHGTGAPKLKVTRNMDIEEIAAGDILFDLDIMDPSSFARPRYLPILKSQGVIIVSYIYDIIAVTHPQYQTRFLLSVFPQWLVSHLLYDDCVMTSAEFTVGQIEQLCRKLGVGMPLHKVVPLGCDAARWIEVADEAVSKYVIRAISGRRYILAVGTLEPRKNHQYLLDAAQLAQWNELGIAMVFVGRRGWNIDGLLANIRSHPEYDRSLYYFDYVDDQTLFYLYQKAYFVVYPTKIEGFGLPTIEAIYRGTPVLCADIPIMHEVAGGFADYFSLRDPRSLLEKLQFYLGHPKEYREKKESLACFVPPSWDESAKKMLFYLKSLEGSKTAGSSHKTSHKKDSSAS